MTAAIDYLRGDLATAQRAAVESAQLVQDTKPAAGYQDYFKRYDIFYSMSIAGKAQYEQGDYADSERTLRSALAMRETWPIDNEDEKRAVADAVSIPLAMAVARQKRLSEAQALIDPIVGLHRQLAARNHGDNTQRIEMAEALYAASLCDPGRGAALLAEAAGLLDSIPATMRTLRSVTKVRGWIRADLGR